MTNRCCIYVPIDQYVEGKGWVPSVVTENEPGHAPLTGQGELAEPWYWGHDLEQARATAADCNRRLGLSDQDVVDIVNSSISASFREDARRREVSGKLGRR
jgi:hypothetical protein